MATPKPTATSNPMHQMRNVSVTMKKDLLMFDVSYVGETISQITSNI
jgi:hypothetical protein